MVNENNLSESVIFPKGERAPEAFARYFSGTNYLKMLVPYDSPLNCPIVNVTFEPGCHNNWHKHPGGQILLVTGGRGWYQEEGKETRELYAGDVVEILPNVKHWHGAAKDSWFVHLSVEADISAGPVEWLEPVTDEEYNKLK
jgi:quercetin dioxygenase-like cupin family protein